MKVLILTNGDYGDYSFCAGKECYDYVICADNGMQHARRLGFNVDLIVGDFDSTSNESLDYFEKQGIKIQRFTSEKDETDTEIALVKAIEAGASAVDIYGGLGTRFDHTFANVHLLYKGLRQQVNVRLINHYNKVQLIDRYIEIKGSAGDLVSLLPFSQQVSGLDTVNLAYPLKKATLTWGQTLGISNYMLGEKAAVSIETGLLLVIKAKD